MSDYFVDRKPEKYQLIGKKVPLVDGLRKVTGTGIYTDDIKLPGMLTAKLLRSPLPHAKILSIDTAEAENMPGVHAVVTGRESAGKFGVLPISKDETAFAMKKALFVGDQVAAVAAEDEETAIEALKKIKVEYQELKTYRKAKDGLQPVPEEDRIHEKTVDGTQIQKRVEQNFGDVAEAFKNSKAVAGGDFDFVGVTHAFTEPHCVIAHYEANGRLTMWSATQVPHYLHRALAEVMGMEMHRIRVIRPMVGGAFGGKSDPFPHEMAAALLSRKSGRPVKILFDREESFISNHGRHPTDTKMSIGCDENGIITGLDVDALIDGGGWGSFGVVTTYYNGVLCSGPYKIPNFKYRGRRVYSNRPPCGAMRGHGAVNSRFAMETLIDELATSLKMDPLEFRLKNLLPPNSKTVTEFRITTNGTQECLERVRERSEWDKRWNKMPYGKGIGIACGFYISGSALPIHWSKLPMSTAHIKIDMDGGVTVHCMAAEIGQGSDTMLAQCAAEPLGIDINRVRVFSQDSDTDPIDIGSYSSRVTFMAGNAAMKAGIQIAEQLRTAASKLTGYPREGFILRDEKVIYAPNLEIHVTFMEALTEALAGQGALQAKGVYAAAPPMGGKHKGAAAGLSPTYSFQSYAAMVDVDPETGFVKVEKVWAAHDCGRALNPLSVEGQIEGCIHMGLGQALQESFDYNRQNILNPNFLDYRCLSSKQMPEVDVILVETDDPEGPFGAKEAGEGPLLPILPAVANAIHDAVGVRMRSLPMTPDKILTAIEKRPHAWKGVGGASPKKPKPEPVNA